MGTAVLHAGHVGKAKAQVASPIPLGALAVEVSDLPEDVGPLGVSRQKHHPGFGIRPRALRQFCFGHGRGLADPVLAFGNGGDQVLLALAAVEGHAQITGHLTQLTQGEAGQGGQSLRHGFNHPGFFGISLREMSRFRSAQRPGVRGS